MNKIAIIVKSEEDYLEQKKIFRESKYFASNFITYLKLKKYNISYLFDENKQLTNDFLDLNYISQNWYRGKNNRDLLEKNGISIAIPITRRILTVFANNLKVLRVLEKLLSQYDFIHISDKSEESFLCVAQILKKKVKFFSSKNYVNNEITSVPSRTKITSPKVYLISYLLRTIQRLIKYRLNNKILINNNWHYRNFFLKKSGTLYMNSFYPQRGYYFTNYGNNKYYNEAIEIFRKNNLKDFFDKFDLQKILISKNVKYEINTVELLKLSILKTYDESYKNLRKTYAIYRELFSFYKPRKIMFSGTTHFEYILGSQIARKYGIETIVAIDGHSIIADPTAFYKDSSSKKFVFDKFIAYGSATYDLYLYQEKIPKKNLILAQSPLFKFPIYKKNKPKYDVIILSYYPNLHNPSSKWDKRFKFVEEIMNVLIELKYDNIIIKIKDGIGSNDEINAYKSYFDLKNLKQKLVFKKGKLSDFYADTKIIVGQISTAAYEASTQNIPFYVYEPYESGLIDNNLKNGYFSDFKNISRTAIDLRKMLQESGSLKQNPGNYISNGPKIDKINF